MELKDYLNHLNEGKVVKGGSDIHLYMHKVSDEARRITSQINGKYHTNDEIRELFSKLIGKEIGDEGSVAWQLVKKVIEK